MRALVTGASGFIGGYLTRQLKSDGYHISYLQTRGTQDAAEAVFNSLERVNPDIVFNMAGVTHGASAAEIYAANVVLPSMIMDAAMKRTRPPIIILAGSAAEYGPVPPGAVPVKETWDCRPVTDYGLSKQTQTQMALLRARAGLPVIIARIWNPVGPGMSASLALGSFAAQIISFPASGGTLNVGDLEVQRDFLDVREVARLLSELARRPEAVGRVCNICAGRAWRLRDIVDQMIMHSKRHIEVRIDPQRVRPNENPVLFGDTTFMKTLGLVPVMPDWNLIVPEILATLGN